VEGAGARKGLSRLVTMPFRNPIGPVAGAATWVAGATSAVAAATASVASALLAVLTVNARVVATTFASVTVADGCLTVSTTVTTADLRVAGVDRAEISDVVAALTMAECVEFEPVLAGLDVVCSVCGAEVTGGVLA
jgi:hypothetical protein